MRFQISLLFVLITTVSFSQIPIGYYDSTVGLSGDALKSSLHNIIKDHKEFPYTSSNTDVWDLLKQTDMDISDTNNVILLYSGWSVDASQEYNSGKGWSREHVWSKSHGDFGTTKGAGTDVHHLRPADVTVNTAKNNRWFDTCSVSYIDDFVISDYCEWLEMQYSGKTYDNKIGFLRGAFKSVVEFQKVKMNNPFIGISRKSNNQNENVVIERDEFEKMINGLGDDGIDNFTRGIGKKKENKNNYRDYLPTAWKLSLYTGLRREEWATLTFMDIVERNGQRLIITDNKKVERITGKVCSPKVVPLSSELEQLIDELGYDRYRGSDRFLVHPERTETFKTIMDVSSKAFTHYYKTIFGEEGFKQMRCLRKTYISNTYNVVGDEVGDFTSQSDKNMIADHYLNKVSTAKILGADFWT